MKISKGKINNGHWHKYRFESLENNELEQLKEDYKNKIFELSKSVPRFSKDNNDLINKRDIRVLRLEVLKIDKILNRR